MRRWYDLQLLVLVTHLITFSPMFCMVESVLIFEGTLTFFTYKSLDMPDV